MARKKGNTTKTTAKPAEEAPAVVEETPVAATVEETPSETPVAATVEETPESASDPEPVEETPERARDDEGKFVADNKGTQPNEAVAGPAAARPVSPKAVSQALRLSESYFGAGKVSKAVERTIVEALELGHQPCVVRTGRANVNFELQVFPVVFDKNDKTKDAVDSSIVLNIARRLAHAGLYPTRG